MTTKRLVSLDDSEIKRLIKIESAESGNRWVWFFGSIMVKGESYSDLEVKAMELVNLKRKVLSLTAKETNRA